MLDFDQPRHLNARLQHIHLDFCSVKVAIERRIWEKVAITLGRRWCRSVGGLSSDMLGEVIGAALLLLLELIYGRRGLLHYRFFPNSIYLMALLLRGLWLSACFWPLLRRVVALSPWATMLMHHNIISPCLVSELYTTF